MNQYIWKAVAFAVVLALVLPGSAMFTMNIDSMRQASNNENIIDWWPMARHDLENTGFSTSSAPDTNNILWSHDIGNQIMGSPAVVDDKIFIVSTNDNLYCLDATDGSFIWNRTIGHSYNAAPAIVDGRVYIGSRKYDNENYTIHCMDESDGSIIWQYATDDNVFCSPAVADGRLFIGSQDPNLYCLDALNGSLIWNYTADHSVGSPAVVDGRVFFGSSDDNVYCLNAMDGSLIWNYTTDDRVGGSSPAIVNGMVFIGSSDDNVYCLDASDGSLIWKSDIDYMGGSSPAVAYGKVFIGSGDTDNINCLDAEDGSLIWNYTTNGFTKSSPAVADEKVYVGSNGGYFYCLNEANGALIWSINASPHVSSSPAIADGKVFVGDNNGIVYCFGSQPKDHDVGVTNINSPVSGPADVFTPEVTVRNFGLNDETDVPVSMLISKNLTNEYNEVMYIDIDVGESKTVTFPDWTPDDLNDGAYGFIDYDVLSCTELVTDENPDNDCKAKTITLDYNPPEITDVQATPSSQVLDGYVNITATVIDNNIDAVYLHILYPDNSIENFSITQNKTGDTYYCNRTYDQVGVHTFHIWANDTSGNSAVSADYIFEIIDDTEPPVTTHEFDPSNPNGENDWYISDVTITLTATDDLSGVNHTFYKIDYGEWNEYSEPVVISEDDNHVLQYYSIDNAENIEEVKGPFYFKIDQTPPEIEFTVEKTGFRKWRFTADASDETSDINRVEFYYEGDLLGTVTEEPYVWEYSGPRGENATAVAYDNAGNSAEDEKPVSYSLQDRIQMLMQTIRAWIMKILSNLME